MEGLACHARKILLYLVGKVKSWKNFKQDSISFRKNRFLFRNATVVTD